MSQNRVTDPRFTRIYKDPRFKSMAKKDKKVLVDKRFKGIFRDKSFSTKPKFDEYGDEFQPNNEQYDEHFELQEEEEDNVAEEIDHDSEVHQDSEVHLSSVDDDDDDEDIEDLMGQDEWKDEEEAVPEIEDPTNRLALQNYEWQVVSAKDLMVLFTSFVPTGNVIKKISVYQSNFGKERMSEELEHGPREIFKQDFQMPEKQKISIRQVNELILRGDQQDLDVDPNKLRKYEKDRLKYYFAVIECDILDLPSTADAIYKATQGSEFELSNIKIDLRFIPDDVVFSDTPTQQCDKITQQLGTKNILSRAVGHTNVKLTWDEEVPQTNFWQGKTEEELDKIDWTEYLGDCGDEEIENAEEFKEKLFARTNPDAVDWKDSFNKKAKAKKRDFDVEITFNTGFNDAGNAILERDDKKKKKLRFAQAIETPDDYFVGLEESNLNFNERKQMRKAKLREQRAQTKPNKQNKAELELLVDSKPNKGEQQAFNPNDKRFQAVFEDPVYAIDPTDRHFKKDTVGKIFDEQVKRKKVRQ